MNVVELCILPKTKGFNVGKDMIQRSLTSNVESIFFGNNAVVGVYSVDFLLDENIKLICVLTKMRKEYYKYLLFFSNICSNKISFVFNLGRLILTYNRISSTKNWREKKEERKLKYKRGKNTLLIFNNVCSYVEYCVAMRGNYGSGV